MTGYRSIIVPTDPKEWKRLQGEMEGFNFLVKGLTLISEPDMDQVPVVMEIFIGGESVFAFVAERHRHLGTVESVKCYRDIMCMAHG